MSPFRTATFVLSIVGCTTGSVASPINATAPASTPALEDSGAVVDASALEDAFRPPADAGPVNGCETYEDLTAEESDRTIVWIRSVGRKCLQIRKGQKLTWDPQETFEAHPLRALGGTSDSPIAEQKAGTQKYAPAFDRVGTFGFICGFHFDMTGAVRVIE